MKVYEILLTALALSADAAAVSVSCGFAVKQVKTKDALLMSAFFGFFQAAMPIAGFYVIPLLSVILGREIIGFFETFAHFTAFALLSSIGIKMISEAYGGRESKTDPFMLNSLFITAAATSADAAAMGIVFRGFAFSFIRLAAAVILIGLTAFCLSLAGVMLGSGLSGVLSKKFRRFAGAAGGAALILLGIKLIASQLVK